MRHRFTKTGSGQTNRGKAALKNRVPFFLAEMWKAAHKYFTAIAVCHTVVPETKNGVLSYQAESPDEEAIVLGAKAAGYDFFALTPKGGKDYYRVRVGGGAGGAGASEWDVMKGEVGKNGFLLRCHFSLYIYKCIFLPRQARDKHRESSTQEARCRFLQSAGERIQFDAQAHVDDRSNPSRNDGVLWKTNDKTPPPPPPPPPPPCFAMPCLYLLKAGSICQDRLGTVNHRKT
jgi:hypothetical protein